jgi:monovalent cation/hydrogen antiporter
MAASFSMGETGVRFLVVGTGGVLVGLLIGAAVVWLRGHVNDPPVEITISLLTPFAAYLPAEWLHASGVLSTVTAGLVLGWNSPRIMASETRVQGRAVWDMMVFVLNGLVFILIGLQLSTILPDLSLRAFLVDAGFGLMISVAAILVRFGWVVLTARSPGWIGVLLRGGASPLPWPDVVVVGWAGMRGVVSLATALALPRSTPERDLILVATFCVILVTLVGQGISLPWLVRRLGVTADGDTDYQEWRARTVSTDAAVARLAELAAEWPAHVPLIETLRGQYSQRTSHLDVHASAAAARDGDAGDAAAEQELLEHHLIRRAVIDAERAAVLDLRQRGEIADEVWRRVERDLDLEELRLEP